MHLFEGGGYFLSQTVCDAPSDGKLRSCLVTPTEVSLREAICASEPLQDYFYKAILNKPQHHIMRTAMPADSERSMSQTGG